MESPDCNVLSFTYSRLCYVFMCHSIVGDVVFFYLLQNAQTVLAAAQNKVATSPLPSRESQVIINFSEKKDLIISLMVSNLCRETFAQ